MEMLGGAHAFPNAQLRQVAHPNVVLFDVRVGKLMLRIECVEERSGPSSGSGLAEQTPVNPPPQRSAD